MEQKLSGVNAKTENEKKYDITSCKCNDLLDICVASVYHILLRGYLIKKCASCQRFFIPLTRSDAIYCNRNSIYEKGKSCKGFGTSQAYLRNLRDDPLAGLSRRIYMRKQMLARRTSDPEYRQEFETFKEESKQWRKGLRDGTRNESEYKKWLESFEKQS